MGRVWLALGAALLTGASIFLVQVSVVQNLTERQEVVVATKLIPPRSVIGPDEVAMKRVALGDLPQRFFVDLQEVIGRVASETIFAGEAIIPERIAQVGALESASALIPPDKPYAFNVPVGILFSAPPRIQVHDRVDIIGYLRGAPLERSGVILSDLEVIDISPRTQDNVSATTQITLALDGPQIVQLMAARESHVLGIAVRPYARLSGGAR